MLRSEDKTLARDIGVRARQYRHQLQATQEEISEMVELSTQVYSRLERGGVLPSVATLMRLCKALRATPNDLLIGGADSPSPPGNKQAPEVTRLARRLAGLDAATVKALMQLANKARTPRPLPRKKRG